MGEFFPKESGCERGYENKPLRRMKYKAGDTCCRVLKQAKWKVADMLPHVCTSLSRPALVL